MAQDESPDLSRRIQQLEELVRGLTGRIRQLEREVAEFQIGTPTTEGVSAKPSPFTKRPPPPPSKPSPEKTSQSEKEFELVMPEEETGPPEAESLPVPGEVWLQRIGITLLLLGVGFLVKYSIDRGWITPGVRLAMGFGVGVVLMQIGYRIREERDLLSQVLEGGAVAVFYMVGFAAYQWYDLVPHVLAYYYMVGVTILSYWLCLRQNRPSLAVISTLGGLATPFLLHSGTGNLPGLVAYSALVLAGALIIFYVKGWRSLFTTAFLGAWAVHTTELWVFKRQIGSMPNYNLIMQAGLLFTWLGFWWAPVLRSLWKEDDDDDIPGSAAMQEDSLLPAGWSAHWTSLQLALLAGALLTLYFSTEVWRLSTREWGYFILSGAILYGLVCWRLMERRGIMAWLHGLSATALFTIALAYLFKGNTLLISFATEAAALHFAGHKFRARILAIAGHLLFFISALWVSERILEYYHRGTLLFNARALTDLGVMGLALLTALRIPEFPRKKFYLVTVYVLLLLWWNRELDSLPNDNAWVSIVWGLHGTLLFAYGLRRNYPQLFRAGFATLAIVAVKMVLIDLSHLETLWRILLFLGIGAGFLGLSYWARDLWKSAARE